jgi:arylsulfatase A-like enzyme
VVLKLYPNEGQTLHQSSRKTCPNKPSQLSEQHKGTQMRRFLATLALCLSPLSTQAAPNIVAIFMDDMDPQMVQYMPNVKALIQDQGVTFTKAYFNDPLCCPSRASMLTGQYVQNTKTNTNDHAKFYNAGKPNETFVLKLDAAGYRTALVGKYLNNYPAPRTISYTPPGWDFWRANANEQTTFYNYALTNGSGGTTSYGSTAADYHDDVLGKLALGFIQSTPSTTPFFLWLSFHAPHTPSTVAPRFSSAYPDVKVPRTPAFNEADVSDKPTWVRNKALMSSSAISTVDSRYRTMAKSLLAANDWVGKIIAQLQSDGRLAETYIFFFADNGWMSGQHRIQSGKGMPYEESLRMDLHVRGPGIPQNIRLEHLISNADLAPTFVELAGAGSLGTADARSLAPLLSATPPGLENWRTAVPLGYTKIASHPSWRGVRTTRYTWIEWATGEKELYDNPNDQYQLQSQHKSTAPEYAAARTKLTSLTSRLATCAGAGCRAIENEPKF